MKTKMTHTAGPWEIISLRDLGQIRIKGEGEIVAAAWVLPTVNEEANARLIAAAPDLLEAAKRAMHICSVDDDGEMATRLMILNAAGMLRAAIEKAEGR